MEWKIPDKEELKYTFEELKKSRIFLGTLALFVAFLLSFVITPAFTDALKGKQEVVRIITDVKIGDRITDKMLQVVEVGGYNLDENILTKKEYAIGKYALVDIKRNTYVYNNMISNISPLNNDYIKENLDGLKRAISFNVKGEAQSVASKLEKNDIVSLIFAKTGKNNVSYLDERFKFIKILALTTEDGRDFVAEDVYKEDYEGGLIDTITVLVDEDQAVTLTEMNENAVIYAALVYREGQESISKYLLNYQDEENERIKYGEKGITDEEREEKENIINAFKENYQDVDENIYFGNLDEVKSYVSNLVRRELKDTVIATTSEIYKRIATPSTATSSIIIFNKDIEEMENVNVLKSTKSGVIRKGQK